MVCAGAELLAADPLVDAGQQVGVHVRAVIDTWRDDTGGYRSDQL